MSLLSSFCVVLLTIIVSINIKLLVNADNVDQNNSAASTSSSMVSEKKLNEVVASDNICNNNEKNVAFDVILIDNDELVNKNIVKREASSSSHKVDKHKKRPRADQKSLLIIFDGTGSMHDDLQQLRSGAQEIINDLSSRNDSPIFNYVLVVYRDPNVDSPFETHNPTELLDKLKTIIVSGGGDCPELALNGLRIALEFALPNSLAYVFSDATAKDYGFYEDVSKLIQKKQVSVSFLLTGDCNSQNSYGYQVYHKLSRISNGQVYDMNKNDVKDVLIAIKHSVSHNYAALKSLDVSSSGTSQTDLNVDKSISELSVRISGRNPTLSITNPSNETVSSGDELSLQNLKLVNIKDPKGGVWRIKAGADSAHSLRLSALSELKFDFGFSAQEVTKSSETSYLPLADSKNVLSIFTSDPSLIDNLANVTIILVPSNPSESAIKFSIPLKRVNNHIYTTKPFEVPRQMFKIQLHGTDAAGNAIERLISTGLIANSGSAPEVNIESQTEIYEGENLILKCLVKSQISIEIVWSLKGQVLSRNSFSQSNELDLKIPDAKHKNQGTYKCSSTNSFGNDSQEILISIFKFPKVKILTDENEMVENEEKSLRCNIENAHTDYVISWYDQNGNLLQKNSPIYKFIAKFESNGKRISCRIVSNDFVIEDTMTMNVSYTPKFLKKRSIENLVATFGGGINFDCTTIQNPPIIKIKWLFTLKHSNVSRLLPYNGSELIIDKLTDDEEGVYECIVSNKIGRSQRIFRLDINPKAPPILSTNSDIMIANETDTIELFCECENCLPISNFSWITNDENGNANEQNYLKYYKRDVHANTFKAFLKIKSVDESDSGSFLCRMSNVMGEGNATMELLVQSKAKIESILKGEREIKGKLEVLEGSHLSIECVFDGYPEPLVFWQKGQEKIIDDAILELRNISEHDEGNYECIASNLLGNSATNFNLSVNSLPKSKSNQVTTIQVIEGENVEIICDLTGKPRIYWKFNSKELDDIGKYQFDDSKLEFVANADDSGVFNCLGVNDFGKISIDFTLIVMTHPKIIAPDDESLKVRLGANLSLSCNAIGYPEPRVRFVKNNQILKTTSSLHIDYIHSNDSGIFHCIAENEVGSAEKLFYVIVVEHPRIITNFEDLSILTNQSKVVECHATGSPKPKISWKFEDEVTGASEFLELSSNSKHGNYFCVAENSEGIDKKLLNVNIINKPNILPIAADLQRSIKIRENDDLQMKCPFENFNQISWQLNNRSISNVQHKMINASLNIYNMNGAIHNGNWSCTVSNTAGKASFLYEVTVLAMPTISASWNLYDQGISDFLVTESDIDERIFKKGDNLKLNCTSSGSPTPKVIWKKSTDVIGKGEILTINNLQFFHSDIYTCTAENVQGIVKKFFKIDVISQPSIDSDANVQKEYQKVVGDSIILRCSSIIGNPPPLFFWFKDNELLDDETDDHLEIESLDLSHDGKYKCLGKNRFGSAKIDFTISMYESARILNVHDVKKFSRNDDSLQLSCTSRGNPTPIITWTSSDGHVMTTTSKLNVEKIFKALSQGNVIYFDGYGNGITYLDPFEVKLTKQKFYSQLTRIDEKTLQLEMVFKNRERLQNTKFTCYSFNALGRDEKSIDVTINRKPFVNERKKQNSDEIEILEHLPLLLTCLVGGQPDPKITWFKNNFPIYENETVKFLNDKKFLSIQEAFSWNSGNYSCIANNTEGELELRYFVTILSPPRFSDFTVRTIDSRYHNDMTKHFKNNENEEVIHVLKGEDIILECWIEVSLPKARVHWVKLNFYDGLKNELLSESRNLLTLNSIKESSNYLCYANNTVGNIQRFFFIDVQYPPEFYDRKTEEHVTVQLNHGKNFECKVKSSPEAVLVWTYNSTNITKHVNDYYFSSNNEIMRIASVNKNHEGKFICTATNKHGSIQKAFYVKVEIPIQFSPWSEWSLCSITCGYNGVQYRSRTCILLDLAPSYNCSGENMQIRKCNDINCPVNGRFGNFSTWSLCPLCYNEDKERPKQKRFRKCDAPLPAFGGLNCEGNEMEERDCEINYCPIHGGWSEWSSWGECSKTCGRGLKVRKRYCNNPAVKHNGNICEGENVEYEECKVKVCSNYNIRKQLSNYDDYDESTEKFKEFVEFEMIDNGQPKLYKFSRHREVEFSAPPAQNLLPSIKISLDTYKPISEETYNNHLNNMNNDDDYFEPEFLGSTVTSTESTANCGRGFQYNSLHHQCEEIDECKNFNACRSDEKCINTVGSYRCERRSRI